MKKLFLIAALAVSAYAAQAQEAKQGDFNVGLTAGIGLANIRLEESSDDQSGILNFSVGGVIDYTFADNFFLESGLTLQRKGCKYDFSEGSLTEKLKVNLFYLQVPVLLNYKFNLGSVSLIPQVGPYFGIGIAGKTKSEASVTVYGIEESTEEESNSFGDENGQLRRFDFGFRFAGCLGLGDNAKISIGYDLGCVDLDEDTKTKNGVFFGTFTYYIK